MSSVLRDISALATEEGFNQTNIPGVRLFKASRTHDRLHFSYAQGIVFVIQGEETVFFGGNSYQYDAQNYLVLPVPIIAECQVQASEDHPMLALLIDIDLVVLKALVSKLITFEPKLEFDSTAPSRGLFISSITSDISATLSRLLNALRNEVSSDILGPQLTREILFHTFMNNNGREFLSLISSDADLYRIESALKWIHENYHQTINIAELSHKVHMAESTFHRVFKRITKLSPGQYLKQLRLDSAKSLLLSSNCKVHEAAFSCGYNSTTQFSREFKRHYGVSPSEI